MSGNDLPAEGDIKLTDARGFGKPLEVAKEFVKFLADSPHNYRLALALSSIFHNLDFEGEHLRISDRLWIYKKHALEAEHVFSHPNAGLDARLQLMNAPPYEVDEKTQLYAVYYTSGVSAAGIRN